MVRFPKYVALTALKEYAVEVELPTSPPLPASLARTTPDMHEMRTIEVIADAVRDRVMPQRGIRE